MHGKTWKQCGAGLALVGSALAARSWAFAQEAKTPESPKAFAFVLDDEAPKPAVRYRAVKALGQEGAEARVTQAGEYWIGVQLATLDELARSQLKLEQGVAAQDVIPDSPAAKAGLQKHDVLLQFGESAINTPDDLIAAVEKAKENSVDVKVLRGGKETVIRIAPAKRAKQAKQGELELKFAPKGEELQRIEAWVQRLHKGEGGEPFQMQVVRPGVMLPHAFKAMEYPKDLSININKQGNEPAKISVKRGDKSWEVTADKISDLPADVRPFVEHLLAHHGAGALRVWFEDQGKRALVGGAKIAPVAPVPAVPGVRSIAPPVPATSRIQVREYRTSDQQSLEAVQKELQALLKKVEDMRASSKVESPTEKMRREIEQLRKELDELRKSTGKQ